MGLRASSLLLRLRCEPYLASSSPPRSHFDRERQGPTQGSGTGHDIQNLQRTRWPITSNTTVMIWQCRQRMLLASCRPTLGSCTRLWQPHVLFQVRLRSQGQHAATVQLARIQKKKTRGKKMGGKKKQKKQKEDQKQGLAHRDREG